MTGVVVKALAAFEPLAIVGMKASTASKASAKGAVSPKIPGSTPSKSSGFW